MATSNAVTLKLTTEEIGLLVHMARLGMRGLLSKEKPIARELLQRLKEIKETGDVQNND